MRIEGEVAVVTGGASGLGLAAARRLLEAGARVTIVDLPTSDGATVAASLGGGARFGAADVTSASEVAAALDEATAAGPLRAVVHCAGRSQRMRVVDRDGEPGSLDAFEGVVRTNLVGSFNVLRLSAAKMAGNDPLDGDRGVVVLTASIAAWEGQIGQVNYAASKAGIVGMTLVAARDLAGRQIRVCTVAPGVFDTPLMNRVPEDVRASIAATIPHPRRMGQPDEFGRLVLAVLDNPMLNGETIRLDGAVRLGPR